MQLMLSIVLSAILGCLLLLTGPMAGGLLAFGIISGTLFGGVYLLNDLHKRLLKDEPKPDKAREDYYAISCFFGLFHLASADRDKNSIGKRKGRIL